MEILEKIKHVYEKTKMIYILVMNLTGIQVGKCKFIM